ncbi:guanylate kinase-related [Holotrichia oblita]|uniref:Guanylate kinase-related n=1 Tax=Holotrichia oblita TaxID=644536 RepID=A0ACB9SMI4_HOLOL|nr:guanylate kinase-related [Holotrichia oblita]
MSSYNQINPKKIQDLQPSMEVLVPETRTSTLTNLFENVPLRLTQEDLPSEYSMQSEADQISISTVSTMEAVYSLGLHEDDEKLSQKVRHKPPKQDSSDHPGGNTSCEVLITETNLDEVDEIGPEAQKDVSETSSEASYFSWPEVEIPGSWGTYGIEENPWDDDDKPFVRFRDYNDLKLTRQEKSGVLTERIIACCSSYLDKCPQTGKYVLCKCNLAQKGLNNISILMFHHYLQYLDLSRNELTNLDALGELPFLMYLDASHNMLTDLLNFKAPFNLTHVNYSHNFVDMIPNLSKFWSLVYLNLSHNQVYQINGLDNLKYLKYLNLSHNQIRFLRGLNNKKLTHLNLEHNQIGFSEEGPNCGFKALPDLIVVNLSDNLLTSLRLFEEMEMLQKLIIMNNNISCLYEIESLKFLKFLTEVHLKGNPIASDDNYYEVCLKCIQPILILDGDVVSAEDKMLVNAKYAPTPFIASKKNHSDLFLLEQLSTWEVTNMTLPITKAPPRMIVVVGPPGTGQKKLIQEFYERHPKCLRLGISHTTRPKNVNETEGECYYFVSEEKFDDMVRNAEFVTVSDILGYAYGFSYEELMKPSSRDTILLLHTDLVGALNLRMRNLRPYLVFALYYQSDAYYSQLLRKYYYTYWLSRNYKALRIINDSGKINSETSSRVTSDIEEILKDIITNLPIKESPTKKSSVKFAEVNPSFIAQPECYMYSTESLSDTKITSLNSDEIASLIIETKKKDGGESSFNLADEDVFHSISEVEFDFEPILSVVSESKLEEDSDEVRKQNRRLKPNQRIDKFIDNILKERELYIRFHRANPGIFCETVFTDKAESTIQKLEDLLKRVQNSSRDSWHSYNVKNDPAFKVMMTQRLLDLNRDIEE